jgi:hypothetical protein
VPASGEGVAPIDPTSLDSGVASTAGSPSPAEIMFGQAPGALVRAQFCADVACKRLVVDWDWRGRSRLVDQPWERTNESGEVLNPGATGISGKPVRIRFVEPGSGAKYLLDPSRPSSTQRIPLRIVGAAGPVSFTVDGAVQQSASWPMVPGSHKACAFVGVTKLCNEFTVIDDRSPTPALSPPVDE